MTGTDVHQRADAKIHGRRIVMLCDDQQIDRRILQEAESLVRDGNEVIVLGRGGEGHAVAELDGQIKIERLDPAQIAQTAAMHASIEAEVHAKGTASEADDSESEAPALDLATAERDLADSLSSPDFGSPAFQRWTARRSWFVRNLIRVIVWPPLRLLQPQPAASASTTTVERPPRAVCKAADRPV